MGSWDLSALQELPGRLMDLLLDPSIDLAASLTLYGILGIVLLIVLLAVIMFLLSGDEHESTDEGATPRHALSPDEDATLTDSAPDTEVVPEPAVEPAPQPAPELAPDPLRRAISFLVIGAIVLGAWVVAGYSTSESAVCSGCHTDTVHDTTTALTDPHENLDCVQCHEPGGPLRRYVTRVPSRLTHLLEGVAEVSVLDEYGRITQRACTSCHGRDIADTVTTDRGLIMSHAEPLAASALCLDCHTPQDGIVASHNAGMNPCIRCHDAKTASSECVTCHDRSAATAARASTTQFAREQVTEIRCGGCHNERRECDSCHGTRMPHTLEFKAYAHSRAAAVDIWYGDGKACSKCHTPMRRPCQKCHGSMIGKAHAATFAGPHREGTSAGCDTCHQRMAYSRQRDFCRDVCHTPAAVEGSPR